jgi:signal peptidase I
MEDDDPTTVTAAPPEPIPAPAPAQAAPRPRHHRSDWLGSVQSLLVTVVIAVFVITFIVQAFQIPSPSMEETLLIGDYLLVDKVHFAHGGVWGDILPYEAIRRGDIVVFRYPKDPRQHFVKRVIGIPGDHIRLRDKQVFVNGRALKEPYVIYRQAGTIDPYRDDFPRPDTLNGAVFTDWWLQMRGLVKNGELLVPPGKYFVLGDNRDESLDSRYWGFVPRENIIGRPLVIYWSMRHPERIGPLAETLGDRLLYFAYTVTHVFQTARWDRALRLIR